MSDNNRPFIQLSDRHTYKLFESEGDWCLFLEYADLNKKPVSYIVQNKEKETTYQYRSFSAAKNSFERLRYT